MNKEIDDNFISINVESEEQKNETNQNTKYSTSNKVKELGVEFTNVCAFVKQIIQTQKESQKDQEKEILHYISGSAKPNEVLALMGPSGSGKTSLLSILGQRSSARIEGTISYGNMPINKYIKRQIGYVSQDDLLYGELTVYETFYFISLLRLPRKWTKEEKTNQVIKILQILGLDKCKDTIIGNQVMRGVSGGERKRVSIGIELLINPSILFMDEPTSGLDSTTALKLMMTMNDLAKEGRTIITSIHQPSSRIFQKIDKLMLFSEGYAIYYGHSKDILDWLQKTGFDLPLGVSIPDHILDLACGEEKFALIEQSKQSKTISIKEEKKTNPDISSYEGIDKINSEETASWYDQVKILTIRCLRTRRFAALSTQRICEIIIVGILAGLFWFQIGQDLLEPQMVGDLSGLLFFQVLFMSFSSLFQSLLTFPMDFQILVKERQSDIYSLSAYYLARTLSDFPMDSLIPSIFCWIIYWMSGLRISANAFFENWFSVLLIMSVSQSLGLLIGACVQNFRTALSFTTVLVLSIMLVGGFYVRNIPVWIRWLKYLSFIYYGYGLVLKIEFNHRYVQCPIQDLGEQCLVSQTDLLDLDVDKPPTLQACMLIAFLLLMRTSIYYALKIKTDSQNNSFLKKILSYL